MDQIKRQQELALIERRKELASLFNSELESWSDEVLSRVDTIEDKKNK